MAKLIDCEPCKGTGKVDLLGYRDMSQEVQPLDKPISRGVKFMKNITVVAGVLSLAV